jgi:GntR family transcriptional regulator, transcriptional repressor for pyruvate dehydrogenase complex
MILLIGSLELIWSAHESSVWADSSDPAEPAPMVDKTRRAALRDHQRLLDAISDGNPARAARLAQDHLAAARRNTLAFGTGKTIEAKLMSDIGSRLESRFRSNGWPKNGKESGA